MKKYVVWDLWGGGNNSLRCAFKKYNKLQIFDVYTFDIVPESSGFKNIVIDLAQEYLISKLDKLIKDKKIKLPDIIVCSPLCQSFSKAMQSVSSMKDKNGNFISGNPHHYWDENKKLIRRWPRNKNITWNGFSGNSYPKGSKSVPAFIAELGERCCQNAVRVICHYKPKYWYIENPKNSYMWLFIKHNLGVNGPTLAETHYSAYNSDYSKKPTAFLNNVNLTLRKSSKNLPLKKINSNSFELILSGACKNKKVDEKRRINAERKLTELLKRKIEVKLRYKRNSMERSKIPPELLIDIFTQFINNKKNTISIKSKNFSLTQYSNKEKNIDELLNEEVI